MFKWSIATVCLGGTLEGKLTATARAGFRAVEIFENDLTFFSGNPRDVRRMAEDLGLSIVALQPMRDFEAMPDPVRARNFERARRKFDLMEELGTTLLCICSNVSDQAIDAPERAAEDLAALAGEAAQRGFRIGYEALAWGRHVRDWTAAWDIVRTADQPNLGIVLDSFHAFARKNPIGASTRLVLEQLFASDAINAVFEKHRVEQYTSKILFATVVQVMLAVVSGKVDSAHAAMQRHGDALGATVTAFYRIHYCYGQ